MNIMQCTICKKPFQSLGRKICPDCLEQIDKDFITVRDYIYEHKQTNIDKVSEETEVSKQTILHLLKEGRLILDGPEGEGILTCESCKKPINSGRLCKECQGKIASKMQTNVDTRAAAASKSKEQDNFKGSAKLGKH